MADTRHDPVVVIGLGRFGSALALELTARGTEVLAVDSRAKTVQALSGQLTHCVTADCTDVEALHQLGVPEFSRAVVGIGTDIESSILVTSLLSELEIETIWAKAITRQHGRILERIGAHHVVFPEHDMGERVAHLVSSSMLDYVELDEDHALIKTNPPQRYVGVPLRETRPRSRSGVTIVAVQPHNGELTHASADTVLNYGDAVFVLGRIQDVERFAEST
ncbi:TrkA family potassium uptake protein [Streptomyces sp. PU-14G]|uniref:potassium channel family protein n=1 Tax=Streptomyces sp. PU-14G TaxID=2800808 RepID=UPI0034DFC917